MLCNIVLLLPIYTLCYRCEAQYGVRDLSYSGAFSEINVLLLAPKQTSIFKMILSFLAIEYKDDCEHGAPSVF